MVPPWLLSVATVGVTANASQCTKPRFRLRHFQIDDCAAGSAQAPGHHAGPFDAEFLGGATSRSMRCRTSASSGVPRGRSAHGGLAGGINGRCSGPSDRPVSGTTGRYKSYRARYQPARTAQVARQAGSTGQMHPGSPGHETTICRGARLFILALTRSDSLRRAQNSRLADERQLCPGRGSAV